MKAWLRGYGVALVWTGALLPCGLALGVAACSPDDEAGKITAAGASAGIGGEGEIDAGGGASARGGSPGAGGSSDEAGTGNSAGGAGSSSTSSVRERFAQAMCHAFISCAEARKDFITDLLGDEARCEPIMDRAQEVAPDRRELLRLVASDAVEIDESSFATCLELSKSCVFDGALQHEACRRAIAGRVAAGEPCHSSAECEPETYCQADDAAAKDTCSGKCAARKPAESECGSSEECASDGGYYRCEKTDNSPTGTCRTVTVETDLAVGAACGTAIATEAACSANLWCRRSDSKCAEPIARDEPCTDDYDVCENGYFCTGAEGARSCQRITITAEEGAACASEALDLCDMTLGLECIDSKCQKVGDGSAGTHCGVDSFNCGIGFYCDRESDTCQPRLAASSVCTTDRQCESGTCDASTHCAADYCAIR